MVVNMKLHFIPDPNDSTYILVVNQETGEILLRTKVKYDLDLSKLELPQPIDEDEEE